MTEVRVLAPPELKARVVARLKAGLQLAREVPGCKRNLTIYK
jgi:hypothetical protein